MESDGLLSNIILTPKGKLELKFKASCYYT
jgi:hypothetical protein